ncbi:hypothetical protein CKM354_001112800 [Cercospora kikuchii]|uniref:NACHT domain-containing protein n=1 Tax=Cercospora kikuchii TaxID=84275 RepID=A0A9P3CSC7_9PEZI|nr:uncharacterized protein CKM354_001112800 [Cercospora kikuchii]GIZ48053.1 hypothetical protein CKM354_001112800 [Cercospora kikuchii]
MAEGFAVLGAVSAVLQVVDFSAKLIKYAGETVNSGNNAVQETTQVEAFAQAHKDLAEVIRSSFGPDDTKSRLLSASDKKVLKFAETCHDDAQELLDELKDLRVDPAATGLHRVVEGTKNAARVLRKREAIGRRRHALTEQSSALQLALVIARDDEHKVIHASILSRLAFPDMQQREGNVADAHANTFDWAIGVDSIGLKQWLQEGSGMFWITGKPGSGKSTMMKYLVNGWKSREMLHTWAGKSELALASFYFWYLGSGLQKSLDGLLRTLLHELLVTAPDLAKHAFPDQYSQPRYMTKAFKCDSQTLSAALERLSRISATSLEMKRLCFFIDGLDEFDGDHLALVRMLDKMARQLEIKICVSSRPWNVFIGAYEGRVPLLRMEELTKDDIHQYVYDRVLSAIQSRSEAFGLPRGSSGYARDDLLAFVREVTVKAEGVFLWVVLVVQDMISGINEGDTTPMLRRRVQSYPPDLEEFFKILIYDRVDRVYADQTSQALVLAHTYGAASSHVADTLAPSLFDYWLLFRCPEGLQDSEFAYKFEAEPTSQIDLAGMARQTRSQLSSACKDLLVIEKTDEASFSTKVRFLHRTVYDFLDKGAIYAKLTAQSPSFFRSPWVLRLFALARAKYLARHTGHTLKSQANELINACFFNCPDSRTMSARFIMDFERSIIPCLLHGQTSGPGEWAFEFSTYEAILAFRCNDIFDVLDIKPVAGKSMEVLILATLGMSSLNQFGLLQVNLNILQRLIGSYSMQWMAQQEQDAVESRCSVNCWAAFLRAFNGAYEAEIAADDSSRSQQILVRGWIITKMFLDSYAPLNTRFCVAAEELGGTQGHEHQWRTAMIFLRQRIPSKWLKECPRLSDPFLSWMR